MDILWLDQPDCRDPTLVGGKAANLSRLAADYPVAPGFCLTTAAFDRWMSTLEVDEMVSFPPALPSELYDELAVAYRGLAERCGVKEPVVAVRSSAVDEDSATASFAGQHETYLNVVGVEAVAGAMARCWASAWSPRALEYRRQHGLTPDGVRLAVLVQQLVMADASAVAFSADPVTGHSDEVVINASWGLGESIVSGLVSPDTYVVRKADLAIVSRQVAEKRRMTVPASAGTSEVDVPSGLRSQPALDDDQIVKIARLAIDLEAEMSWPVDVECAYQGGDLYLLQCRPITALEKRRTSGTDPATGESPVLWDRLGDELLTWSRDKTAFPEPLAPLVQSYLPYHTQGWARANRARGTAGATRIRFVNGYLYTAWQPVGLTTWEAVGAAWREAERVTPERWEKEWLPAIKAELERLQAVNLQALAADDLSRVLQEALTRQVRIWEIHAHMGSAPLSAIQRLVDWYLDRFPEAPESEPYKLLQGQRNSSVESDHHLWRLSRMVTPAVAEPLRSGEWEHLPEPFRQAFAAYLDEFGHHTQAIVDPGSPTWFEDPRPVAKLILNYVESDTPDPYLEVEGLAAEREQFTVEVRARLAPDEREEFDQLLGCALANYPLTENHAYWLEQQSVAAIRYICAEFGRRMVATGALDSAEDISFLTLNELIMWGFGLADPLRPRVARRRAEYLVNQRITPPDSLGAPLSPETWVDRYSGPSSPQKAGAGEIRGVGASAGVARGPARIARTLDQALTLQQGEVLVCVSTDPNWTPLFGLAAALVTDAGGSLCHAAVVAREYRLPAVVGTQTATQMITHGQIVEVDGVKGLIRLF